MDWWHLLILLFAGIGIGYFNAIAGGGTFITIPLLMLFGVPIQVANGTHRISILLHNLSAFFTFKSKGIKVHYRLAFMLSVITTMGAIFGAFVAARVNPEVLRWVVFGLIIILLALVFVKPMQWVRRKSLAAVRLRGWDYPIFFAIGLYGGFIQTGAGLIITMALILRIGFDAVSAEAVKSLIMISYTIFAIIVFMLHQQVDYLLGLALATGSLLGAGLAARHPLKQGAAALRYAMVLVMIIAAAYLLLFAK